MTKRIVFLVMLIAVLSMSGCAVTGTTAKAKSGRSVTILAYSGGEVVGRWQVEEFQFVSNGAVAFTDKCGGGVYWRGEYMILEGDK